MSLRALSPSFLARLPPPAPTLRCSNPPPFAFPKPAAQRHPPQLAAEGGVTFPFPGSQAHWSLCGFSYFDLCH